MPFFPKSHNRNKKDATLQVRLKPCCKIRGRRVLSSVPFRDRGQPGSMTIEAALSMSLFLFAVVLLMIPFRFMDEQRKIQAAMESAGESFAQSAYGMYSLNHEGEPDLTDETDWKEEAEDLLIPGLVQDLMKYYVNSVIDSRWIQNISFKRTEVLEDGEHIKLVMDYTMKLPFSVFGIHGINASSVCYRRAWIGRDGGRTDGDEREEDQIVYVGKNRGRYHFTRSCHYLSNDLTAADYDQVSSLRNQSGGTYRPCHVCAKRASSGMTVYVMPSGETFHVSQSCFSIISYVQAVRLSEVKELGACSYCSRTGGE